MMNEYIKTICYGWKFDFSKQLDIDIFNCLYESICDSFFDTWRWSNFIRLPSDVVKTDLYGTVDSFRALGEILREKLLTNLFFDWEELDDDYVFHIYLKIPVTSNFKLLLNRLLMMNYEKMENDVIAKFIMRYRFMSEPELFIVG